MNEHGNLGGRGRKWLPFLLGLAIVVLDQILKAIIVLNIPMNSIGAEVIGDFFRIIHVRNTGIAFSLGDDLEAPVRLFLFVLFPSAVLIGLSVYSVRSHEVTKFQRWVIAAIVGGGFGNLIDRIFRPEGVVDFLDFKFYGILGMERFPTFNLADSSLVVSGILLLLSLILPPAKSRLEEPENRETQELGNE